MPYTKDGIKYPRCTGIISDCTSKGDAMTQWAANCVVEYMKESLDPFLRHGGETWDRHEFVLEQLDKARFAHKSVSDTALDIGSEVHNAIEKYLQRRIDKKEDLALTDPIYLKLSDQARQGFNAFIAWEETHDLKPIELEKTVYGSRWAGTLDFYGYFDDKLYVIDWKTSKPKNKKTGKGIYPEMRYQVAAYRSVMRHEAHETFFKPIEGCGVLRLDKETGMPDWNDTSKTYDSDLRVFNRMVDLYFERHARIAKRFKHGE